MDLTPIVLRDLERTRRVLRLPEEVHTFFKLAKMPYLMNGAVDSNFGIETHHRRSVDHVGEVFIFQLIYTELNSQMLPIVCTCIAEGRAILNTEHYMISNKTSWSSIFTQLHTEPYMISSKADWSSIFTQLLEEEIPFNEHEKEIR